MYAKMKELGPIGGHVPGMPPRSAMPQTVYNRKSKQYCPLDSILPDSFKWDTGPPPPGSTTDPIFHLILKYVTFQIYSPLVSAYLLHKTILLFHQITLVSACVMYIQCCVEML